MPRPPLLLTMLVVVGVAVALVSTTSGNRRGRHSAISVSHLAADVTPERFASPAAVYAAFREAVAAKDWRREFECYTPKHQAEFCHHVVATALGVEFEMDLAVKTEAAFAKHGLTETDLQRTWPSGSCRVVEPGDEAKVAAEMDKWYGDLMTHWTDVIYVKIKNPVELVATLQPLIREADRRRREKGGSLDALRGFDDYCYGRIRSVEIRGDEATAKIPIKSVEGSFVESTDLDEVAEHINETESGTAPVEGEKPDAKSIADDEKSEHASKPRAVLANWRTHSWLWEVADRIKSFTDYFKGERIVFIGLRSGDVTVASEFEFDIDDGMMDLEIPGNGTAGTAMCDVKFRRVDGQWRIDAVDGR